MHQRKTSHQPYSSLPASVYSNSMSESNNPLTNEKLLTIPRRENLKVHSVQITDDGRMIKEKLSPDKLKVKLKYTVPSEAE